MAKAERGSPEWAHAAADEISELRRRWGAKANAPYTTNDLIAIIDILREESMVTAGALKDELTTARRQVAAANARAAKKDKAES